MEKNKVVKVDGNDIREWTHLSQYREHYVSIDDIKRNKRTLSADMENVILFHFKFSYCLRKAIGIIDILKPVQSSKSQTEKIE